MENVIYSSDGIRSINPKASRSEENEKFRSGPVKLLPGQAHSPDAALYAQAARVLRK